MKRIILLPLLLAFFFNSISAQTIISGVVTGVNDGETIPGVNVTVKGTKIKTKTNLDGWYKIDLPDSCTVIIYSFVGFESREVIANGKTIIDITLEIEYGIYHSPVTALGITRKEKGRGYSATEFVNWGIIENYPINFSEALKARVAGVQVSSASGSSGASSRIIIRGLKSLSKSNQPLIIVDGVPINNP